MTLFEDELSLADANFASINLKFMEAVTESVEEGLITEKEHESLFKKAKKFIADLISAMENFVKSIVSKVNQKIAEKSEKAIRHKIYMQIKTENDLNKTYTVPDDKAVLTAYKESVDRLDKYVKNFTSKTYKSTIDIENDIEAFNNIYDECDKKIQKAIQKTINIKGEEYIRYVERNLSGRDNTIKQLNEYRRILDQLKISCERADNKLNMLGSDILPKKIGFFRSMGIKITAFFRKWISKIVSILVFFFPF